MNDSKKFTQRPNWLFQTKLSPTAREVYTVLLSHAWGDKTEVYPSVDRIAEMAGVGRFAAYEALHVLEGVGMVIIDGSAGSNRYTINRRPSKADVERICGLSKAEIQSLRRYDTVRKPNTELGPECSDSKLNAVCYPNGVCLESEHEVDERNRRRRREFGLGGYAATTLRESQPGFAGVRG